MSVSQRSAMVCVNRTPWKVYAMAYTKLVHYPRDDVFPPGPGTCGSSGNILYIGEGNQLLYSRRTGPLLILR